MPARKTAKKAVKKTPRGPKTRFRARIRMYRQGIGDCFLLTFPRKTGGDYHLMIDCGVVLGTPDPASLMLKVAKDLRQETGGKIDTLVITHEHWDHLSGFSPGQGRSEFEQIKFGQLWLAWTENPKNELANQLREERERKKVAAQKTAEKLKMLPDGEKRLDRLSGLLGFLGVKADGSSEDGGEGEGGTGGALAFLKKHIKRHAFLTPGGGILELDGVENLRIYVLGPPENREKLRRKDPGKQGYAMALADTYAAALDASDKLAANAQPFEPNFRRPERPASYDDSLSAWRKIEADWLAVGERLALQLDSDTNNTSLVLAFEFVDTRQVLMFVGDAQAGNWLSWDDHEWKVRDASGEFVKVNAADLLARTVLYKVGHHGSHNATLREKGLERMLDPRLISLMPVNEKIAHEKKHWTHMPLPSLVTRLKQKSAALLRSDETEINGAAEEGFSIGHSTDKELYFDILVH